MRSDVDAIAFGAAVALGALAIPALISAWFRRKMLLRPKPPGLDANWKQVGTLARMTIYPLKSCKGIDLKEAKCTQLGLSQVDTGNDKYLLKDRYFMVFREDNGEMATGRTYPVLLLCEVSPELNNSIRLSHPNAKDIVIQIPSQGKKITRMWGDEPVECLDCGDEASAWISQVINKNRDTESNVKMRIGFWPSSQTTRDIIKATPNIENIFKGITNADGGAFSDLTSYMLMISSSVDEVNRRSSGVAISERQFRPNFYVKSDEPAFSDLKWKWVKIGDNIFRVVKGCKRCVFTTIDPETTQRLPNNEPLNTLNSIEEAKCKEPIEESPMMGIHLAPYGPGQISINQSVFAL